MFDDMEYRQNKPTTLGQSGAIRIRNKEKDIIFSFLFHFFFSFIFLMKKKYYLEYPIYHVAEFAQ